MATAKAQLVTGKQLRIAVANNARQFKG